MGVYVNLISEEELEVIENDYADSEWYDYIYKSQKYDFTYEYYYNQLSCNMKKAYDQLDIACATFLTGEWYEVDVTRYDNRGNDDLWLNKSTATFLANDAINYTVEVEEPMYIGITFPRCTDDDPSGNVYASVTSKPSVTPFVGGATVSWDAVSGASMYWVYVYSDGLVTETPGYGTSFEITGVTPGQCYGFVGISYMNATGWDYNCTAEEDMVYAISG